MASRSVFETGSPSHERFGERIAANVAVSRAVSPARRATRADRSSASSFPATRAKNKRAARRTSLSLAAAANASNALASSGGDAAGSLPGVACAGEGAGRVARNRAARCAETPRLVEKRRHARCTRTAAKRSRAVGTTTVASSRDASPRDADGSESSTESVDSRNGHTERRASRVAVSVFGSVRILARAAVAKKARLFASAAKSLASRLARRAETRPRRAAAARATRAFAARAFARVRSISCACVSPHRTRAIETRAGRGGRACVSRASRERVAKGFSSSFASVLIADDVRQVRSRNWTITVSGFPGRRAPQRKARVSEGPPRLATPRAREGFRRARSAGTRSVSELPRARKARSRRARARRVSRALPRARARTAKRLFFWRENKPSGDTGRAYGDARAYLEPLRQS